VPKQWASAGSTRLNVAFAVCVVLPAQACWEEAATRYRVSPALLYAIALVESNLDPRAVGQNRNGTRDIGLMQINSGWLPRLAGYGIEETHLYDPCTSIHVGAWILAENVSRLGYTWEAVGAYNATSPHLREAYAAKVRRTLATLPRALAPTAPAPTANALADRRSTQFPVFHP